MSKECWQLKDFSEQTTCFKKAGGNPCSALDCLVEQRMEELIAEHIEIHSSWGPFLLHSKCRISSLSLDNQEFQERVG